jgi:sugar O-acyltransferase (sialic acid O-acetyltransferase NeuD family)
MNRKLIIVGTGGHASSVTNVALSCGYQIINYIDRKKGNSNFLGVSIISNEDYLSMYPNCNYFIAIGDNYLREKVYEKLVLLLPKAKFPCLIHPKSIIGVSCKIGNGTIVMPGAHVGSNTTIGKFCIVNTNASIDHDSLMKDYSSLAPGVTTGGNIKVGIRSAISIGSTLKNNIQIGSDTIIGACSFVNKNITDNVIAYGIPCKKIKDREIGEPYLNN